jgi:hypothetical protein
VIAVVHSFLPSWLRTTPALPARGTARISSEATLVSTTII